MPPILSRRFPAPKADANHVPPNNDVDYFNMLSLRDTIGLFANSEPMSNILKRVSAESRLPTLSHQNLSKDCTKADRVSSLLNKINNQTTPSVKGPVSSPDLSCDASTLHSSVDSPNTRALRQCIRDKDMHISKLNAENEGLFSKLFTAQSAIEAYTLEIADLREQNSVRADSSVEVAALRGEIDSLKRQLTKCEIQIDNLIIENNTLRDIIASGPQNGKLDDINKCREICDDAAGDMSEFTASISRPENLSRTIVDTPGRLFLTESSLHMPSPGNDRGGPADLVPLASLSTCLQSNPLSARDTQFSVVRVEDSVGVSSSGVPTDSTLDRALASRIDPADACFKALRETSQPPSTDEAPLDIIKSSLSQEIDPEVLVVKTGTHGYAIEIPIASGSQTGNPDLRSKKILEGQERRALSAKTAAARTKMRALESRSATPSGPGPGPSSGHSDEADTGKNGRLRNASAKPQVKGAVDGSASTLAYVPSARFDNSAYIQKIIQNSLLPGSSNYERRVACLDKVASAKGHLLIVLRDAERKAYHSCVRVSERDARLVKVDGPQNMPEELPQSIIEHIFKFDSSSKAFVRVGQRSLSTLVSAVTLRVKRKPVSGRRAL